MKLLVGLGNPGEKYEKVRHNLGFTVLDQFVADRLPTTDYSKLWTNESKFKAEVCRLKSEDLVLVKPQTYMNNSGLAVKLLTTYYKIPTTDVIVIHDDLDILLGKFKIRLGGAGGGHHGVESIIEAIGDNFWRVRLGIGNERSHSGEHNRIAFNAEHFVLEPFMPGEKSKVKHMIKQAIEAIDRELLKS